MKTYIEYIDTKQNNAIFIVTLGQVSSGSWSASASSVLIGLAQHQPIKAIDGLTGDMWATFVSDGQQYDWLQVDFGQELTVPDECTICSWQKD